MPKEKVKGKAWIVSVSIGYEYQRIAHNLRHLSPNKQIINADNYEGILEEDKKIWENIRTFYKVISNFEKIPLIGNLSFEIFNQFQKIQNLYPKNQNVAPTFILKQIFNLISKGWGKHFIETLKNKNNEIPFVSTFFVPAFMAEYYHYPGKIACVICDADISRSWVPIRPQESRIIYFAPTSLVVEKLIQYGVKKENIFLTGFPLPKENLGTYKNYKILKQDIKIRILNLDPKKNYQKNYENVIKKYLGKLPQKSNKPLTLMFSISGAGIQKEIVVKFIKSLAYLLQNQSIHLILAGGDENTKKYFLKKLLALRLGLNIDKNIFIINHPNSKKYFELFNEALRRTDILWTKPSELSFYAGLGIPIIIAPPLGFNEKINKNWLIKTGAGVVEQDPKFAHEWIFDLIRDGSLAKAAMQGFIEIKKEGVWEIERILRYGALIKN